MDAASQPAPPRRRTPRRTYTATRVSHPNCSWFTCPAAGLPSPLTHLWRPPAIAGAGGHTQVDSGTPYRGHGQPSAAGQAPSSPDQAEQRRPAHNPSATQATSPSVAGPACTPAATHHGPEAPAPVKAARAQPSCRHLHLTHRRWSPVLGHLSLSRGGTHPSPPAPSTRRTPNSTSTATRRQPASTGRPSTSSKPSRATSTRPARHQAGTPPPPNTPPADDRVAGVPGRPCGSRTGE